MKQQQKWSLIIFCYNEEGNIRHVIQKAVEVLGVISPEGFEIIIVDDGSTDRSREIIREETLEKTFFKVLFHRENLGIGKTLTDGYALAVNENVCAVPGDGQFDLDELLPFSVIPDDYIISFFRRKKSYYSFFRQILTRINKLINYYFLGIKMRDVNWVKVYKNDKLKKITTVLTSSLVESEICAKMMINRHHLVEVESVYHPRRSGESKGSSMKIIFQAMADIFKLIRAIKSERSKTGLKEFPPPDN